MFCGKYAKSLPSNLSTGTVDCGRIIVNNFQSIWLFTKAVEKKVFIHNELWKDFP